MRLAVVPCSARKLERPAPAELLYTGPLFRSAYMAASALRLAGDLDGVLILSARHGLVEPRTLLAPYNVRMGDPRSVTAGQLGRQLDALQGDDERGWDIELLPLLPRDYQAALEAGVRAGSLETFLEPNPLEGSAGLLEQRRRLRELREAVSA